MHLPSTAGAITRMLLASSIAIATAGTASVAHAGYLVRASAESDAQLDYGRGYNAGNYRDGPYGGPGYTHFGGVCTPGAFTTCSVGGSGTTDSNPNLKAAMEATFVQSAYNPLLPAAASAYATASLAGGYVGAAASGTYGLSGCCSGQDGGSAIGYAEDSDLLHFTVDGAGPSAITVIGISFHVHGSVDPFTPLGDSGGGLTSIFGLGTGFFEGSVGSYEANPPVFTINGDSGWLTNSVTQNTPGDFTFNATYALHGDSQDLGIDEYLEVAGQAGTAYNYAHTATVALTLPSSVSFTSDSGVFPDAGRSGASNMGVDAGGARRPRLDAAALAFQCRTRLDQRAPSRNFREGASPIARRGTSEEIRLCRPEGRRDADLRLRALNVSFLERWWSPLPALVGPQFRSMSDSTPQIP